MMLKVYRLAMTLGEPLLRAYLHRRLARAKEDPARFCERLGHARLERPQGPLVWVHGASIGEAMSVLPLIERIVGAPGGWRVLMSTGTVTSARLMAARLPEGAFHQYIPVDHPRYARRFVDHWRPDLAIWVESEFWPTLLDEAARRGIVRVLLNGRISARSYRRWRRPVARGLIARLLGDFSLCLGQSVRDSERLAALGADPCRFVGNLKYAAAPLPVCTEDYDELSAPLAGRAVWLAASTHPGEEIALARIHKALKPSHRGLLTLIVPRHPERGEAIAAEIRAMGLNVAQRSQKQKVTVGTDVYLADTIGELGLFYRLCPIVFIGKSLGVRGGQNPIEAAQLNCAILFGPAMDNFSDIAAELRARAGALQIEDEADLERSVDALLQDKTRRAMMADNARAVAREQGHVLDQVFQALEPFLLPRDGRS